MIENSYRYRRLRSWWKDLKCPPHVFYLRPSIARGDAYICYICRKAYNPVEDNTARMGYVSRIDGGILLGGSMKPILPAWAAFTFYWFKIAAAVAVPVLVAFGASQQTAEGLETQVSEFILDVVPVAGSILVSIIAIYHQLKGSPPQR